MSPFEYRLEKVLTYRKNKKEEQLQRVIKAQQEVARIQGEIDKNKSTIMTLRQNMPNAHHTMLESYDAYIKHIYKVIDQLEEEKMRAIRKLEEEKRILAELEKSIKALEKHREKKLEEWEEEQRQIEMKILDEVGAQKHFAKMLEKKEDEALEELMEEDY
jgi:flagellar FliJ protein